jgi:AraC family transcriptional regulator
MQDMQLSIVDRNSLERLQSAVGELFHAISNSFDGHNELVHECLRKAGALLHLDLVADPPASAAVAPVADFKGCKGGLAPWQVRKLMTYIESNIDSAMATAELADLVKLSPFHFCRVFRESFCVSPHAYLMRRRIERAQGLMLSTSTPLGQIAVECGLSDQAHFNKLFLRYVGETPGAWRRARQQG